MGMQPALLHWTSYCRCASSTVKKMSDKTTPPTVISWLSFVAIFFPSYNVSVWLSETGSVWSVKTTKVIGRTDSCNVFHSLHVHEPTDSLFSEDLGALSRNV